MFVDLFTWLALASAVLLAARLAWWWWRHGRAALARRKAGEPDAAARKRSWVWFPWLSLALCIAVALPWINLYARALPAPPDLPASDGWVRKANVPTMDLSFRCRYLRWRVPASAATIQPLVADWVMHRGRWWMSRQAEAEAAQRSGREPDSGRPCTGQLRLCYRAGRIPLLGAPEPEPDPAETGITCWRHSYNDVSYGAVARVTPTAHDECTVELWLALMRDL